MDLCSENDYKGNGSEQGKHDTFNLTIPITIPTMRALPLLSVLCGLPSFATLLRTEFPHLLIPLISSTPDTAYGTRADATISYSRRSGATQYTEISFDVPSNEAAICRLNFKINTNPVKNAPRQLSGEAPYAINISRIEPRINAYADTWNSRPGVTEHYATYTLHHNGTVREVYSKWFDCPKGQIAQFLLHPASQRDLRYYWFELDYPQAEGGPHGVVLEMHT